MKPRRGQRVRFEDEVYGVKAVGTVVQICFSPGLYPYRVRVAHDTSMRPDYEFVLAAHEITEIDPVEVCAGPPSL